MKRTLRSTIAPALTALQSERVEMIDAEDFIGVKRKTREDLARQGFQASDAYLDEGILALQQYYAIALLDPTSEHAVSDEIDPFWHAHILHTEQYIAFGERVFGQYIQHTPLDHDDPVQVQRFADLYAHTASVYPKAFNYISLEFFPAEVAAARLVCGHVEIGNPVIREQALDFEQLPIAV